MPSDKRAANGVKACEIIESFISDSNRYQIKYMPFNSNTAADFAPAYYADKVLFASDRMSNSFIKRNYSWTNAPFLNIMSTSKTGDNYSTPILFRGQNQH